MNLATSDNINAVLMCLQGISVLAHCGQDWDASRYTSYRIIRTQNCWKTYGSVQRFGLAFPKLNTLLKPRFWVLKMKNCSSDSGFELSHWKLEEKSRLLWALSTPVRSLPSTVTAVRDSSSECLRQEATTSNRVISSQYCFVYDWQTANGFEYA